jgi:hypothetical protein
LANAVGGRGATATNEVKEAGIAPLSGPSGITLDLPLFDEIYLGPPENKESIWEALGFTATSDNTGRTRRSGQPRRPATPKRASARPAGPPRGATGGSLRGPCG